MIVVLISVECFGHFIWVIVVELRFASVRPRFGSLRSRLGKSRFEGEMRGSREMVVCADLRVVVFGAASVAGVGAVGNGLGGHVVRRSVSARAVQSSGACVSPCRTLFSRCSRIRRLLRLFRVLSSLHKNANADDNNDENSSSDGGADEFRRRGILLRSVGRVVFALKRGFDFEEFAGRGKSVEDGTGVGAVCADAEFVLGRGLEIFVSKMMG